MTRETNTSGRYVGLGRSRPRPLAVDLRLAEMRAGVCGDCDRKENIFRSSQVIAVRCKECGCGNRSLVSHPCPIGKHDGLK